MEKQIPVSGSPTWSLSDKSHANLTYTVTEVHELASRTAINNDQSILVNQIQLTCNCNGDYVSGTSTFFGTGSASILAPATRTVECEGKPVLLLRDEVTITCQGTITITSTGVTSPSIATVKATITTPNQENICLDE